MFPSTTWLPWVLMTSCRCASSSGVDGKDIFVTEHYKTLVRNIVKDEMVEGVPLHPRNLAMDQLKHHVCKVPYQRVSGTVWCAIRAPEGAGRRR